MGASPDSMSQMLQGLLGDPSASASQGGLMGAINQALAPYGGANQVALSLLSNKSGGSNPLAVIGQSLQSSQQQQMENQSKRLQLAQQALSMPQLLARAQQWQQAMGAPQGPGTTLTGTAALGGAPQPQGPQGPQAQQGQAPGAPQQSQGAGVPVPQERQPDAPQGSFSVPSLDIGSLPVNGKSPQQAALWEQLNGKDVTPTAAAEAVRKAQLQVAQSAIGPRISALDTIIQTGDPTKIVASSPALAGLWRELAPTIGVDPNSSQSFTPDNVRLAFGARRNELAAWAQLPRADVKAPLKTTTLPDGRTAQIDQLSGKEDILSSDELQQVIGPDGKPTLVPRSKAAYMTPYNASQAAAGSITDQAKEQAYQRFKVTAEMPAAGRGSAASQAVYANYFAKRAAEDGDDGAAQAARTQQYKATQGVVKDFTSGKTATTLNGLNTAIGHMDLLDRAATALQNGDVQAINKLKNFAGTQFGSPTANNFNVIRDFAAGEIAKAVLPGGGGEAERQEIADAVKSSNSPAQLHSAIGQWRDLLGSKTDAIRNQWEVGTNGQQGSFDKFLLPATKKALGIGDTAPPSASGLPRKNPQGWVLHRDAEGNKAYVSPDGKQFTAVP